MDQFILNPPNMHHMQTPPRPADGAAPLPQEPLLPQAVPLPDQAQQPEAELPPAARQLTPEELELEDLLDVGDDYGFAIVTPSGGNTPQYEPEYGGVDYSTFVWGASSSSSSSSASTASMSQAESEFEPATSARTRPREKVFS